MVIKLIVPDTVEAKILTLQEKKQALVESLITTERSAVKSLTRDDVAALLG
jgi:SNF2 family DNA or RNA helicase